MVSQMSSICRRCGRGARFRDALCASCARYASVCDLCGKSIRTGGSLCRQCFTRKPIPTCSTCGKRVSNRKVELCRDCWANRGGGPRVCITCGTRLRSLAQRCWACHAGGAHPRCIDCQTELPPKSRATRCWACHLTRKQAAAGQKRCSRPDCDRPHRAKGYCLEHYQYFVHRPKQQGQAYDGNFKMLVKAQPCAVCGYDRMPSEPHRIIPGGPYELGNLVPVCARCHDEIERGLTPCPPAWQPADMHSVRS
jgi:hypothetical protein